jgi:hypothetical protein
MGSRNRGSVTYDRDASSHHMVRSEVANSLSEGLSRCLDDLAKGRWKQLLCVAMEMLAPPVGQQTFGDRIATQITVAINHDLAEHSFIRHTVPNPVVESVASAEVVLLAGDEIAEDVGTLLLANPKSP